MLHSLSHPGAGEGSKNLKRKVSLYLGYHGEPQEEPNNRHDSDEDLFAIPNSDLFWEQIRKGSDESLHADELRIKKEFSSTQAGD